MNKIFIGAVKLDRGYEELKKNYLIGLNSWFGNLDIGDYALVSVDTMVDKILIVQSIEDYPYDDVPDLKKYTFQVIKQFDSIKTNYVLCCKFFQINLDLINNASNLSSGSRFYEIKIDKKYPDIKLTDISFIDDYRSFIVTCNEIDPNNFKDGDIIIHLSSREEGYYPQKCYEVFHSSIEDFDLFGTIPSITIQKYGLLEALRIVTVNANKKKINLLNTIINAMDSYGIFTFPIQTNIKEFYQNFLRIEPGENDSDIETNKPNDLNNIDENDLTALNMIYYGAPGTGKSYKIDELLKKMKIANDNIIRVVFHYDYNYSDFIGYITPKTKNDGDNLEYKFIPGPFTKALERAFKNIESDVYLVIEEINRGNSAAIFGDIFQLLDRDEYGNSCFPITNSTIREFLNSDKEIDNKEIDPAIFERYKLGEDEIIIPSNLKIICTMNTADQNVFTLDSAFKRRFKMKYLSINFKNRTAHLDMLDRISEANVFDNKSCWTDFAVYVNNLIDGINSSSYSISEDKKLGQYFVDEKDVSSKQAFCDKVIYYLKNDVFKYNDSILNESYERIYERIVIENDDIYKVIS